MWQGPGSVGVDTVGVHWCSPSARHRLEQPNEIKKVLVAKRQQMLDRIQVLEEDAISWGAGLGCRCHVEADQMW